RALNANEEDGHGGAGLDAVGLAPAPLPDAVYSPAARIEAVLLDEPAEPLGPGPSPVPRHPQQLPFEAGLGRKPGRGRPSDPGTSVSPAHHANPSVAEVQRQGPILRCGPKAPMKPG